MGRDNDGDLRCFDCELNIGRSGRCPDCEAERDAVAATQLRRNRQHAELSAKDRPGYPHPHMGGECVDWETAARISADGV